MICLKYLKKKIIITELESHKIQQGTQVLTYNKLLQSNNDGYMKPVNHP